MNGSVTSELPPWSAGHCNISETMEETNKAEPAKPVLVNNEEHSEIPVGKNATAEVAREVEGSQDINLVYSNVEDVCGPATAQLNLQAQGNQTIHPKPDIKELAVQGSEGNENDLYETIFPSQPSRPAPPKPVPYSSSKKSASGTAGKSSSEKVSGKVTMILAKCTTKILMLSFKILNLATDSANFFSAALTKPGSDWTGLDHGPDHGSDHGSDHTHTHTKKKRFKEKKKKKKIKSFAR